MNRLPSRIVLSAAIVIVMAACTSTESTTIPTPSSTPAWLVSMAYAPPDAVTWRDALQRESELWKQVIVVCGPVVGGSPPDTANPGLLWLAESSYMQPFIITIAPEMWDLLPQPPTGHYRGKAVCVQGTFQGGGIELGTEAALWELTPETAQYVPDVSSSAPPADSPFSVSETDILCPSDVPEAADAFNSARDAYDRGQADEAERLYLQAIDLDPSYCDAMDNLGLLLRQMGRVDEAIEWYSKSLEVLPTNTVALQNLAVAYDVNGRTEEAEATFLRLIDLDPSNAEGYYGLGNMYVNLGLTTDAIPYLNEALAIYQEEGSPFAVDAHFLVGLAFYYSEDCLNAIPHLEASLAVYDRDPTLNYSLGLCYLAPEVNQPEKARPFLEAAEALGVEIPAEVKQLLP